MRVIFWWRRTTLLTCFALSLHQKTSKNRRDILSFFDVNLSLFLKKNTRGFLAKNKKKRSDKASKLGYFWGIIGRGCLRCVTISGADEDYRGLPGSAWFLNEPGGGRHNHRSPTKLQKGKDSVTNESLETRQEHKYISLLVIYKAMC